MQGKSQVSKAQKDYYLTALTQEMKTNSCCRLSI
jgi:hypothetical protein